MRRRIPPLVLTLCALSAPASAQTATPRSDEALAARQAKAASPEPYAPGRVEQLLTMVETNPMIQRAFTRRDGFGVRVAGIEGGSPLAAGPSWRRSGLAGGNLQVHASAAASFAADTEVEAGAAVAHTFTRRLAVDVTGGSTHLANERFFGPGNTSVKADETAFAFDRRTIMARGTFTAARWLNVTGAAGSMTTSAADAAGKRAPAISTRFTSAHAPGLAVDGSFRTVSVATTVDYRDVPQNPRSGGRYHLSVARYADGSPNRQSFTRIDAEAEQHLSAWKRQRVLTLRAIASSSVPDPGNEVPFYLQPTLGGSSLLRGFVTDRFRDRNLLAVQAEYGWDVTPFLNAVVFYEAGAVASRWTDIAANDFRRDYGLGFRFGSARTVAFRTDVALGSGEGTRITMRLNHAF